MNEELYIQFENYLSNEMPQEEKVEFENKLQNDSYIRAKFEAYKETKQFLSAKFDSQTADFKQNLKSISKEYFKENKVKPKVISFKPWQYAVAASMVLVFGILFTMTGDPSYSDYNQHEMATFAERSTIGSQSLKEAQDAFNRKDYKKAVESFKKNLLNANSPECVYFMAISAIEINEYSDAEILLKSLQSGTSVYKDKATWYLALSNLKQKKFDECKKYLKQIPSDAEDFEKAQKLLKDLD